MLIAVFAKRGELEAVVSAKREETIRLDVGMANGSWRPGAGSFSR